MAYTINNFIVDRIMRGIMLDSSDKSAALWSVNQITNPSLSCTTETADAVDMMGTPIMTLDRSKKAEFSAENALFDLALAAAQFGSEKEVASASKKLKVPAFETIDVTSDASVTLKHAPIDVITCIYALNGDSTLGTKYANGATASATDFVHAQGQKSITLPTGLKEGSQIFVIYEYETESAVSVSNSAINFPQAGTFMMEVLGYDVCDQTKIIHAFIEFPKAKLSGDVDLNFSTEGTHSFKITCMPDYCDKEKKLFRIVVPDEE